MNLTETKCQQEHNSGIRVSHEQNKSNVVNMDVHSNQLLLSY